MNRMTSSDFLWKHILYYSRFCYRTNSLYIFLNCSLRYKILIEIHIPPLHKRITKNRCCIFWNYNLVKKPAFLMCIHMNNVICLTVDFRIIQYKYTSKMNSSNISRFIRNNPISWPIFMMTSCCHIRSNILLMMVIFGCCNLIHNNPAI